jgi:hypothetical protein
MSTALAVAGVTAVLRDAIDAWLIDQNANAALGGANAEVTAVAPDTIELTGTNAGPRLNLFLHHVTPNAGWRNADLPSVTGQGERAASPPLALDLHYLLTAYGPAELQAEVLLGFGMQRLHQTPVLARAEIEARLPVALRPSMLGRQVESIRVTPEPMGTDELSKLWTALQAHYRPSTAYHVSVVLIEGPPAGRAPAPVLSRGPRDAATGRERGVVAAAGLAPVTPEISAVRPPTGQNGAGLGQTVTLVGSNLSGSAFTAVLENRVLEIERRVPATATAPDEVSFTIPNAPAQLSAGLFTVRLEFTPTGSAETRETNDLAMILAPRIANVTTPVARDGQGRATISVEVRPQVRPYQRVSLILGSRAIAAEPHPAQTAAVTFIVPDAQPGTYLAAVRVDGIDSPRVDRAAAPPAFVGTPVVIQ